MYEEEIKGNCFYGKLPTVAKACASAEASATRGWWMKKLNVKG